MKVSLISIAYIATIAMIFVTQAVGSYATSRHTIAKEELAVGGRTVTARVLDDRTVIYQPFMTKTTVSMERGKLNVVQTTAASRGVLVKHREPTAAEAALWNKYFVGA